MVNHTNKGLFRLTGFYGNPDMSMRHFSWQLLERLSSLFDLGWYAIGDINEILSHSDKVGGQPRAQYLIDHFTAVVDNCLLRPFPFSGYKFTWSNGRVGEANVKEQLDRCFVSMNGQLLFPHALVHQIPTLYLIIKLSFYHWKMPQHT